MTGLDLLALVAALLIPGLGVSLYVLVRSRQLRDTPRGEIVPLGDRRA